MGNLNPGTVRYGQSRLITTMVIFESISRVHKAQETHACYEPRGNGALRALAIRL